MLPLLLAAVGGYLVYDSMKSEKFADGGQTKGAKHAWDNGKPIKKVKWVTYALYKNELGYTPEESVDLTYKKWDELTKDVQRALVSVMPENMADGGEMAKGGKLVAEGGMMADGGEVDKLRNDIIKLEDYISKLKDVEKYENEDEEKVITNKETRIFFEKKLEKLKKRLEELESDGGKMAKGGITTSEITDFKEYVKDNYAKGGTWSEFFPPNGATRKEIDKAVNMYVYWCRTQKDQWGGGDTFDREIVRDIMLANRGQSRNFEYPKQVNAVLKFNAQLDAAKMRKK